MNTPSEFKNIREIKSNIPEETVIPGDRILVDKKEHIIAQIGPDVFSAISLQNGNRLTDPVYCHGGHKGMKISDIVSSRVTTFDKIEKIS